MHTRDIGRALRAMRRIPAGTVWINRFGRVWDFIMPTGGFKGSGIGKDLGRQAFQGSRASGFRSEFPLQGGAGRFLIQGARKRRALRHSRGDFMSLFKPKFITFDC